jgi:hypothetical protein
VPFVLVPEPFVVPPVEPARVNNAVVNGLFVPFASVQAVTVVVFVNVNGNV